MPSDRPNTPAVLPTKKGGRTKDNAPVLPGIGVAKAEMTDHPPADDNPATEPSLSGTPSPEERPLRGLPEPKLYQDEIYGTKELSPLAVALIDTPEFQRLSHIYQLGFAYVAFRGATHRRFDRCIGTYFIARTLLRRIVQNHSRLYRRGLKDLTHPGLLLSPRLYVRASAVPESN